MRYNSVARLPMENILGIILSVSFSVAYFPQILKMIKRKKSDDVSLIMLIINGLGYLCGLGYVLMKGLDAFWLTFNYSSGFIMTFFCIVTWLYYEEK